METNAAMRAKAYYTMVGEKDVEGIKTYLHPDVELFGPMAALKGREAVVQATHQFMKMFASLTIRAAFGEGDQAVVIYEVDIPGMTKAFPGASWIWFRDEQIVRIQLFYDASQFLTKKEEIFSR